MARLLSVSGFPIGPQDCEKHVLLQPLLSHKTKKFQNSSKIVKTYKFKKNMCLVRLEMAASLKTKRWPHQDQHLAIYWITQVPTPLLVFRSFASTSSCLDGSYYFVGAPNVSCTFKKYQLFHDTNCVRAGCDAKKGLGQNGYGEQLCKYDLQIVHMCINTSPSAN